MFEKKLDFFPLKWALVDSGAKETGGDIYHSLRAASASQAPMLKFRMYGFYSTTNNRLQTAFFNQIIIIVINDFTDNNFYYLLDK